eukprot:jgi/Tetstr1/435874/TSEL_024762.t1
MLDTKKPELELHAAQLDDCRINPSNLEEAGPQRLGTVSVTRKQREKFHVMEKVLKNHAISTPALEQVADTLGEEAVEGCSPVWGILEWAVILMGVTVALFALFALLLVCGAAFDTAFISGPRCAWWQLSSFFLWSVHQSPVPVTGGYPRPQPAGALLSQDHCRAAVYSRLQRTHPDRAPSVADLLVRMDIKGGIARKLVKAKEDNPEPHSNFEIDVQLTPEVSQHVREKVTGIKCGGLTIEAQDVELRARNEVLLTKTDQGRVLLLYTQERQKDCCQVPPAKSSSIHVPHIPVQRHMTSPAASPADNAFLSVEPNNGSFRGSDPLPGGSTASMSRPSSGRVGILQHPPPGPGQAQRRLEPRNLRSALDRRINRSATPLTLRQQVAKRAHDALTYRSTSAESLQHHTDKLQVGYFEEPTGRDTQGSPFKLRQELQRL